MGPNPWNGLSDTSPGPGPGLLEACVTVTVWPLTVMVPLRSAPVVLAATLTFSVVLVPAVAAGVSHGTPDDAVHPHEPPASVSVSVLAVPGTPAEVGDAVTIHGGGPFTGYHTPMACHGAMRP